MSPSFAAVGRDDLACSAARKHGRSDKGRGIKRPLFEEIILTSLKARLMLPDLVSELIAAYHTEVNQANLGIEQAKPTKERELAKATQQTDGLVAAIAECLRVPSPQEKLDGLEVRKATLKQQIAEAPPPAPRLHPKLAEVCKVGDLPGALARIEARDAAPTCLRSLIERLVVTAKEDGLEIELVGEIARMVELPLSDHNKKAILDERTACSAKLVAGAGFEPGFARSAWRIRPLDGRFRRRAFRNLKVAGPSRRHPIRRHGRGHHGAARRHRGGRVNVTPGRLKRPTAMRVRPNGLYDQISAIPTALQPKHRCPKARHGLIRQLISTTIGNEI